MPETLDAPIVIGCRTCLRVMWAGGFDTCPTCRAKEVGTDYVPHSVAVSTTINESPTNLRGGTNR